VLTKEGLAFGAGVLGCFHRVNATRDQAARPTPYYAKEYSQDPSGRVGICAGCSLDCMVAEAAVVLHWIRSKSGLLDDDGLWWWCGHDDVTDTIVLLNKDRKLTETS